MKYIYIILLTIAITGCSNLVFVSKDSFIGEYKGSIAWGNGHMPLTLRLSDSLFYMNGPMHWGYGDWSIKNNQIKLTYAKYAQEECLNNGTPLCGEDTAFVISKKKMKLNKATFRRVNIPAYVSQTTHLSQTVNELKGQVKCDTTYNFVSVVGGTTQRETELSITNGSSDNYLTWYSVSPINSITEDLVRNFFMTDNEENSLINYTNDFSLYRGSTNDYRLGTTFVKRIMPGQSFSYYSVDYEKEASCPMYNHIAVIKQDYVEHIVGKPLDKDMFFPGDHIYVPQQTIRIAKEDKSICELKTENVQIEIPLYILESEELYEKIYSRTSPYNSESESYYILEVIEDTNNSVLFQLKSINYNDFFVDLYTQAYKSNKLIGALNYDNTIIFIESLSPSIINTFLKKSTQTYKFRFYSDNYKNQVFHPLKMRNDIFILSK